MPPIRLLLNWHRVICRRPHRAAPGRKQPGRIAPCRRTQSRQPPEKRSPNRRKRRGTFLTSRRETRVHLQRPGKCRQNLTFEMSRSRDPGSFLRSGFRIPSEPVGVLAPLQRRRSAFSAAGLRRMTDIQQRLSICRKNTWLILPIVHWMTRRTRRMARESIFLSKHPARRR